MQKSKQLTLERIYARGVPPAFTNFATLPDDALVEKAVLMLLFQRSAPSIYRDVRSGALPQPIRLSPGATRWRVGDLRKSLSERRAEA